MGCGRNAVQGSGGENAILACDLRTGGSNVNLDEAGNEQLTEKRSGKIPALDMRQRLRRHSEDAGIIQVMRTRVGCPASWNNDWPSHNHSREL
jgi:hypothetical protein